MSKIDQLIGMFESNFRHMIAKNPNNKAQCFVEITPTLLLLKMAKDKAIFTITIPIVFVENNISFIETNGIRRATTSYFVEQSNMRFDFEDVMFEIMFGDPAIFLPEELCKVSYGKQAMRYLRRAYELDILPIAVNTIQKRINYIINMLPLHNTYFNSFIMNHRITIIDPEFDSITSPEERHSYQVNKNRKYFERGWSSIGLSDGSLADKNYVLDYDLRKLTPYGINFHNPYRNLYSTLGMKGDDTPLVHSEATAKLAQLGLTRKGWNLFTVFVDIPDVWEDQLMVDISHKDKYIEYTKTYMCYGTVIVKVGDELKEGVSILSVSNDDKKIFDIVCDYAVVSSIEDTIDVIGGVSYPAYRITVTYRRHLMNGTKLTNLAANKGVIRMADLGYAINPATGEKQKIDVIVSAKAVLKRKNYTQVLEAILNTINGNKEIVVPDSAIIDENTIQKALNVSGYNTDGTWECHTYAGKLKAVAGKVFWGVTHDAHDTVWRKGVTFAKNGRGLRDSGLKFSTIEFRALNTRFGKDNPVEKEILNYAQGHEDIAEMLEVLLYKTQCNDVSKIKRPVVDITTIKPVNQEEGLMHTEESLKGTIVGTYLPEEGFFLKLPKGIKYQVVIDSKGKTIREGFPQNITVDDNEDGNKVVTFDRIYVPYYNLRRPWKHDIGKVGLGDIGNALNYIVELSVKYANGDDEQNEILSRLYFAISNYFKLIANKLSTKRGEISVRGMSVRYPHSAKAVATLGNNLEPNTIEIHESMANSLKIRKDDIVLVERFPCLGFMSLRPQKVVITSNPLDRYTIKVSGNSLGSLTLDFDGDVIYIAKFYSKEANKALRGEFYFPNKYCYKHIKWFNAKMGMPRTKEMVLYDYCIKPFKPLTNEEHANIVDKLTGVKSNTGPVIALAYNLLRITENSKLHGDAKLDCGVEVFMDTVANSVFKQKHGKKSLHKIVTDAICTADVTTLVAEGFDEEIASMICSEIIAKAKSIGVNNLKDYHNNAKENGGSNIINRIVREQNVLYFTSRASLEGNRLIRNVMNYDQVDIPSNLFHKIMTLPTESEKRDRELLNSLNNVEDIAYFSKIFRKIDEISLPTKTVTNEL